MTKLVVLSDNLPRRQILMSVGAGALVASCGSAASNPTVPSDGGGLSDAGPSDASDASDAGESVCSPTSTTVGAVSDFPLMTWTIFPMDRLIVGHDAGGLFAYSTVCTHYACLINLDDPSTGHATCPCHGSQYDGNGHVLVGPAITSLYHYALAICDGMVTVDKRRVIARTTRLPV